MEEWMSSSSADMKPTLLLKIIVSDKNCNGFTTFWRRDDRLSLLHVYKPDMFIARLSHQKLKTELTVDMKATHFKLGYRHVCWTWCNKSRQDAKIFGMYCFLQVQSIVWRLRSGNQSVRLPNDVPQWNRLLHDCDSLWEYVKKEKSHNDKIILCDDFNVFQRNLASTQSLYEGHIVVM